MGESPPTLEVIALTVADARAAERGGADRLEVVRAIEADGLTPAVEMVVLMRDCVRLPLRVMLRSNAGFAVDKAEVAALCRAARALRRAGAEQFVFGFLTPARALDLAAIAALQDAVAPCAWTLHRAFDHAADARRAWEAIQGLPGLDLVLSSGGPDGLAAGLATLRARAGWQTERVRWLAGGGLRAEHLPGLRAAGIAQFHAGRAARRGGRWDRPVDEGEVRRLKETAGRPPPRAN